MGRMGEVTFGADGVGAMSKPFIYDVNNVGAIREDFLTAREPPTCRAPLLTLTDIRKSFGGVRALDGASLELHRGAVTALIGENGAGKSTLVKILSGVHQPDAGDIQLDGDAMRIADAAAARELGIGVVHQECLVFDHLTVAENLFVNAQPARRGLVDWRATAARARRPCCASSARTSTPARRRGAPQHRAEARGADRARAGQRIARAHPR